MKKINIYTFSIIAGAIILFFALSCDSMPVGYLRSDDAVFIPDTVYAYRELPEDSDRFINKTPWTSLRIQGVSGTNPVNYEFHSVKAGNGGNAKAFEDAVEKKEITVQGGIILMHQSAVKKIPDGSYTISLRVYNDGHSHIIEDVFTFVIKKSEF